MAKTKRSPKKQGVLGMADTASNTYNDRAGAVKSLSVGPQYKIPAGQTTTRALDASAGIQMPAGTSLALYNNSGTVAWVTMSSAAIGAAPSGLANGIPLIVNGWTYLNMGEHTNIRTSAATVGVYIVEDDTQLTVTPEDQAF